MLKNFAVLLLVAACLVSCHDQEKEREKEKQKIMTEIERLDLLRRKAKEFVSEQEAVFSAKEAEYTTWKVGHLADLKRYQNVIAKAEKELKEAEQSLSKDQRFATHILSSGQDSTIKALSVFFVKKAQNRVEALKGVIARTRKAHDNTKKAITEKEPIYLKQIETLESDLKISQTTYDSLNALHTAEVGKLAKFGGDD